MSEHTPMPWEAVPSQMGGALLIRPIPAGVYAGQRMIQIVPFEDAEFIVQAVNSHDVLVDALKRIREHTDPEPASENYRADDREGCLDTVFSIATDTLEAAGEPL